MNDAHVVIEKLHQAARTVSRRRGLAVATAWVVALAAAVVVPLVPQRYESKARIAVETQSVLKPLMEGMTPQYDADLHLRMLVGTALSGPNLEQMLRARDLGFDTSAVGAREAVVDSLRKRIKLNHEAPGIYSISYRDLQPERARRVVEATVQLLTDISAGDKARDSTDANAFIAEQVQQYEAKLLDAERRLREFKIQHFGVAGAADENHVARMAAISQEISRLRAELQAAEQARSVYMVELARETPQTAQDVELVAQRKHLDDLLKRYGNQHPDVIGTRELIAQIEQGGARRRPSDGVATNPAYLQLRALVAEANAQTASLRSKLAAEQRRLDEIQAVAGKATQVEAELAQLELDHDAIRKKYDQLVARRESASMGAQLEASTRDAEFRVVEPPRTAKMPVFPGRVALGALSIVAALVAAIAVPPLMQIVRPTFDDGLSLGRFTGRPVIGVVAAVATSSAAARENRVSGIVAAAALCLIAAQAAWLAWLRVGTG